MAKKELSIFIDESGDFGPFDKKCPFYIIGLVFHDQSNELSNQIKKLDISLSSLGITNYTIHTAPIIRKEGDYSDMDIDLRRKVLNRFVSFARSVPIMHHAIIIKKKTCTDSVSLSSALAKEISQFIKNNYSFFESFDLIKVYYDNGQIEITKILTSVFNSLLANVKFKRVLPKKYKLFQIADLVCTLTLVNETLQTSGFSHSELIFFESRRNFIKNYWKPFGKKSFSK